MKDADFYLENVQPGPRLPRKPCQIGVTLLMLFHFKPSKNNRHLSPCRKDHRRAFDRFKTRSKKLHSWRGSKRKVRKFNRQLSWPMWCKTNDLKSSLDVVTSLDKVGVHEESKEELLGDEDVEEREEEEKSIHRLQRLYLNPLVELL
jgi:hypothetical protein